MARATEEYLRAYRFDVKVSPYPTPEGKDDPIRLRATRIEPGPTVDTLRIYVGIEVEECSELRADPGIPHTGVLVVFVYDRHDSAVLAYTYEYKGFTKYPSLALDARDAGFAGECYEFRL